LSSLLPGLKACIHKLNHLTFDRNRIQLHFLFDMSNRTSHQIYLRPLISLHVVTIPEMVGLLQVSLLDYGQVKEIDDRIRLGFARLIVALASSNVREMGLSFR